MARYDLALGLIKGNDPSTDKTILPANLLSLLLLFFLNIKQNPLK